MQGAAPRRNGRSALHRSGWAAPNYTDTGETGPATLDGFVASTELCNANYIEPRRIVFIDT
jgi:hypothetical protein